MWKHKCLTAILLSAALACAVPAYASEWKEDRSEAQPYEGVPAIDTGKSVGYMILYPSEKLPVQYFCDVLEIYLPREDIVLEEGNLHLFEGETEVFTVSFADEEQVKLRELEEEELEALMWGDGACIDIYLPVSLKLGADYHVEMDDNCFTVKDANVKKVKLEKETDWKPVFEGDYGVSSLYYEALEAQEDPSGAQGGPDTTAEEAETEEPKTEEPGTAEPETEHAEPETAEEEPETKQPETEQPALVGTVHFDVTLGGDAVAAVVYSENDSVLFDKTEFDASGSVEGTVLDKPLAWGIVFLNEDGDILRQLDFR